MLNLSVKPIFFIFSHMFCWNDLSFILKFRQRNIKKEPIIKDWLIVHMVNTFFHRVNTFFHRRLFCKYQRLGHQLSFRVVFQLCFRDILQHSDQ